MGCVALAPSRCPGTCCAWSWGDTRKAGALFSLGLRVLTVFPIATEAMDIPGPSQMGRLRTREGQGACGRQLLCFYFYFLGALGTKPRACWARAAWLGCTTAGHVLSCLV